MMMKKTQHDLSAWVKSLYEVEKATRYHINDLRSWVKRKMNEEWSTTQLISEFQQNQNIDEDEKNQLITTIQTMNEIESFRASLTFEMRRRAMIFANYSDQRSLLL
jgi:predicted phage tail protein